MVLKNITDNLLSFDSKHPREFKKILNTFPEEYKLTQKQEELLFNAYKLGVKAHYCQKRKSGAKYFDHCIAVCNQLILWNMDINTIVAGLLHDTLEDTELTKSEIINANLEEFNPDPPPCLRAPSGVPGLKKCLPVLSRI